MEFVGYEVDLQKLQDMDPQFRDCETPHCRAG